MDETQIRAIVKDEMNRRAVSSTYNANNIPRHVHNGADAPQVNQANIQSALRASGNVTFAQNTSYRLGLTFNPSSVWFYGSATRTNTIFTVTAANATAGDVYSNNGFNFTVIDTITGATTLVTAGTGNPAASGTLTKVSGSGDATITFASFKHSKGVRALSIGNAQLGNTYYFQPATSTSTVIGGPKQNQIESSAYFLTDSTRSTPVFRVLSSEEHLISIEYEPYTGAATDTIAARATITSYSNQAIFLTVFLNPGWEIDGNYVVT